MRWFMDVSLRMDLRSSVTLGQGDGTALSETAPAPVADEQEAGGWRPRLRSHSNQSRSETSLTSCTHVAPLHQSASFGLCMCGVQLQLPRPGIRVLADHAYSSLLVMATSMLGGLKPWRAAIPCSAAALSSVTGPPQHCRPCGRLSGKRQVRQRTHYWRCCHLMYTTIIAYCFCRRTSSESRDGGRKRKAAAGPSQGKQGSWEPASKRKQRADSKRPASQGGLSAARVTSRLPAASDAAFWQDGCGQCRAQGRPEG